MGLQVALVLEHCCTPATGEAVSFETLHVALAPIVLVVLTVSCGEVVADAAVVGVCQAYTIVE